MLAVLPVVAAAGLIPRTQTVISAKGLRRETCSVDAAYRLIRTDITQLASLLRAPSKLEPVASGMMLIT